MLKRLKDGLYSGTIIFFLAITSAALLTGCSTTPKTASNSSTSNTEASSQTTGEQIYKNTSLGFSLSFPKEWTGKYIVKETAEGIFVYFKPSQNAPDNGGLYFCILKKTKDLNESMYDSIDGKKEVTAGSNIYFLGGPTDVNFPESHPEFNDFIKLKNQIPDIIKSIKPLN